MFLGCGFAVILLVSWACASVKLGFCFLVKDGLNHVSLWTRFLAASAPGSVGVYVHAKTAVPSPVLKAAWIDPSPLTTAWGDRSLVAATQRLFMAAVEDQCDAMVLLSGDMLPLQSFDWVQEFCCQTRLSLQPRDGLNERQRTANAQRFEQIAPYFGLAVEQLRKQNMFFVIQRQDAIRIMGDARLDEFPLMQLADEYYWINHLIRLQADWRESKVVYCNPDPTRTQALDLRLTPDLLRTCREQGYGFIRKIRALDPQITRDLESCY